MANPKTTTYDFKKVSVIVNGVIITGFMDGESIQTEKNEDDVNVHVGADGGVTFSNNNDDTGTITLTVKQTSPSDAYLRQLRASKQTFQTQIIDANDNTFRAGGSECRVIKSPSRSYGNEVTGLEWQIAVADFKEA